MGIQPQGEVTTMSDIDTIFIYAITILLLGILIPIMHWIITRRK